jgi:branched-subunit amino acid aminotransferase/4-amino-4-deoxychorismate lyase
MTFPVFSRNGRILPAEQATVSLYSIEYSYGFGVYETLRVAKGVPYFARQHVDRLERSAAAIGLAHPFSGERILEWIEELVAAAEADVYNIKMLLIGAPRPEDVTLSILPMAPSFPKDHWYRDGIAVRTERYERLFPQAKTLNMLGSYLAYAAAKREGCYDALLVDRDGYVTEGTRTNVLFVQGDILISPPASRILEGVSRMVVQRIAAESRVSVEERDVPLADVGAYDGAVLTSTSTKVLPIARIDAHAFGPVPESVRRVQRAYDAFLRDCGGLL